jgi:hypothetical protein
MSVLTWVTEMSHKSRVAIEDLVEMAMEHPKEDWVWCEGCNIVFSWDKLPDDLKLTIRESHGDPYQTPETQVTGWECPECGHKNDF